MTADLVNRRDAALFRQCSRRAIQEPNHHLQAIVGGDMLHLAQQLASRLRERNILAPTWPNGVRMCWHVCATDAWE